MRLTEGTEIDGRYRLRYRIGSGGMADVWCADDAHLNRQVALKVLHERFAQDRDFVERFRQEASSAAGLQHPNVVAVFDRGEVDGTYYIAMEFVEGSSLKQLISRGLTVEQSAEIGRQLLGAAQFAHERGVIHRDIKPQNILVDHHGRVRVTDFGIAKAGESDITQAGEVVGTATYFSPEQAQGMDVGAAGDLYSIGIVLYEMLTGAPPFEGENSVAVAMKHLGEIPEPPSRHNPAVSPALDQVVLRALAKEPGRRYANANEFMTALRNAVDHPTTTTDETLTHSAIPPLPHDGSSVWRWVGGIATVVALVIFVVLLVRGGEDVVVPTVIAERQDEATTRLTEEGFEVAARNTSSEIAAGLVVEQDPPAGTTAEEGSLVTITISLGPGADDVPAVRGRTEKRATKLVTGAGFEVRTRGTPSASVAEGRAVRTRPAAGTRLERGERVTILISTGSEQMVAPDLVGLTRTQAQAVAREAGLIPNIERRDADEPADEVIEQSPGPGSEVDRGAEITVVVSTGAGSVVLSDQTGQTRRTAKKAMKDLGVEVDISIIETDVRAQDGRVIDQAPDGGTRVHSGDRVTLFVGRFTEPPADDQPEPDQPEPDQPAAEGGGQG